MLLDSSVVRVLAWFARGPGFESRSGHVLFPPVTQPTALTGLAILEVLNAAV